MPKVNYDDFLIESLRDPKEAADYLNAALEECKHGDAESQQLLLMALKNVALAQGGFKELSEKSNLGRESLYKTLSKKGNPKLTTLTTLVNVMGFDLKISAQNKR